jgi:hypothetical protein
VALRECGRGLRLPMRYSTAHYQRSSDTSFREQSRESTEGTIRRGRTILDSRSHCRQSWEEINTVGVRTQGRNNGALPHRRLTTRGVAPRHALTTPR